eukprot:187974-Amphidinium_carterae.1
MNKNSLWNTFLAYTLQLACLSSDLTKQAYRYHSNLQLRLFAKLVIFVSVSHPLCRLAAVDALLEAWGYRGEELY